MKQEINGWIIAKFTTEQKGSLDTFLTSFPQAYDLFSQCWFSSSKASGTVYPLNELVVTFPGGGGGSQQSLEHSALRSNPLTFYFPVIHVSEDIIKI